MMSRFIFVLVACGFFLYYGLWYFRKRRFQATMNAIEEPIDWEEFVSRFLLKDTVLVFPTVNCI